MTDDAYKVSSPAPPSTESEKLNKKEEKIAREREELLAKIANNKHDTLNARVAFMLNHEPETRDSDVTLQIRYWHTFESELISGSSVSLQSLYKLTRLTSLSRARAKIQNDYHLFQASDEVRHRRRALDDDEREKQVEDRQTTPWYIVYADESGKTGTHLIIGSMWILHGMENVQLQFDIQKWRDETQFKDELHFAKISNNNVGRYFEVLDILYSRSATIGFKALQLERKGQENPAQALDDILFHLLDRGISHEHESGRAKLPRFLQVWKDAEEASRDKLMVANLKERLLNVSLSKYEGKLRVDLVETIDSKSNVFMQFADLFTSSVNRVLNGQTDGTHPKDLFAREFLNRFGADVSTLAISSLGDVLFVGNL